MTEYTFEKNQPAGGTGYYIFQTGTYQPQDLVMCCKTPRSNTSEVAFQANYLATGEHV